MGSSGSVVLAGLILNGAWTQLDTIGWPVWLLPAVTLALDSLRPARAASPLRTPAKSASRAALLIGALICGVHLLHVALTAREEFGFGGDEGYHLSATRAFAIYFMHAGPYLAGVLALFVAGRRFVPRYAATVGVIGLIVSSFLLPDDALFGRYPTGFYLLSTPLNVALDVAHIPYPFTANHIINMLSLPAWLFVLRPALIGRWPDWRVLPVALLMYFQGPSIVYTSSGLLEPWAFAFVLLALEAIVALEPDRRWIAMLLAGTAACFKDTAILFVPPIWLLAMVEWHGWRPSLRSHAISIGVAAVAPFVAYYAVRRGLHIVRGYDVAHSAALWTAARAQEWTTNARYQLGLGGSISVAALSAWCAIGIAVNKQAARHHVVWLIAAIALVIFFAADVASIPFTGYGRFLAYPLLALCAVMFATTYWLAERRSTLLMSISLVIAVLQIAPATHVLALDFQPDYERNSLEWTRGLVRFPIRSLSRRLSDLPGGSDVSRLRVVTFGIDLTSVRVAYPDLAKTYDLQPGPDCQCRLSTEAVLAGFEWPVHFAATPAGRDRYQLQHTRCVAEVRATCASAAFEQRPDGAIVGALGVGAR